VQASRLRAAERRCFYHVVLPWIHRVFSLMKRWFRKRITYGNRYTRRCDGGEKARSFSALRNVANGPITTDIALEPNVGFRGTAEVSVAADQIPGKLRCAKVFRCDGRWA
jgi:hypothetical protein